MKSIIENVIKKGGYDLAEILAKIDVFFAEGKLTAEERDELYELARVKPEAQYDVKAEIKMIWLAIEALRNGGAEDTEEIKPWEPPTGAHDAYNKGKKMLFTDGLIYESTMDGNVWSPLVNPNGWKVVK